LDVSPASIAKAVSGFANTSGGEIYVGIDESIGAKGLERAWRGFPNVETANGLLQAIESVAPLAGHYEAAFLAADRMAGLLLHLTLSKTREVIYASNDKAYIRRGAQSLPIDTATSMGRAGCRYAPHLSCRLAHGVVAHLAA
jgi:ATP-dependent DNA helicase RecG